MVIILFLQKLTIIILVYMWRVVKKSLFFLMHVIINIIVTVQNVYRRFWVKRGRSPCEVASEIRVLIEHMPRLSKHLQHLVVLVDTERHCISDLARVVIWSLVARVAYVSFHDITGNLKQDEEKLLNEVERHKKGVPGCIKWANKIALTEAVSELTEAHTVVMNIFNSDEGRPKIAQVIRRIAAERTLSSQNYKEITVQELNSRLSLVYHSLPDPDLILYTGPSCCTRGLLPWQIRLTEFVRLSHDYSFNIESFVRALYKYNKCDQRFGR